MTQKMAKTNEYPYPLDVLSLIVEDVVLKVSNHEMGKKVLESGQFYREKFNERHGPHEPVILVFWTIVGTLFLRWLIPIIWSCVTFVMFPNQKKWKQLKGSAFRVLIKLPFISGFASKEMDKTRNSIHKELMKLFVGETFLTELPSKGKTPSQVMSLYNQYENLGHVNVLNGSVSGAVYAQIDNPEFIDLMKQVYGQSCFSNPLHPDIYPAIRKMESEVVRMACNLFQGPDTACGTMTTGGTESILMACKAWRDYARNHKGITEPEMVVPQTVHAAFDKASEYFGIKINHIPVDPRTGKVIISRVKSAINRNTILIVGSSPNFPHGIVDDIDLLSNLGIKYGIPVHVDACLGGFLIPFLKDAGFPEVRVGNFTYPGVMSISADTHKYGYCPKGSSVVLYRHEKYRVHQFSVVTDWPGGVYASPTVSGSRVGAGIAVCWSTLMYYGKEGYVDRTRKIIQTSRYLRDEITKIPNVYVFGNPLLSVIAVGSHDINALQMCEQLTQKGWHMNSLQFPSGFHICVTLLHTNEGVADRLIQDIKDVAEELGKDPNPKLTGQAAVYGLAQILPDRSMISDIAKHYLNSYYSVKV